jgi:hypothetical protein
MNPICYPIFYVLASFAKVHATYSIVATDAATRQIGGAGASCLSGRDIFEALYVSVPNHAVMHTQGLLLPRDSPIITTARDMMKIPESASLDDILNNMQTMDTLPFGEDEEFPEVDLRQYGIANFNTTRGYTGKELVELYKKMFSFPTENYDVGGSVNMTTADGQSMEYHALANVVSEGTVNLLEQGFKESDSDDLAVRLMAAMTSVVGGGAGDGRCINGFNTSASGAFLHVDNPDGSVYLHLNIVGSGITEPIVELQRQFNEWKASYEPDTSSGSSYTTYFWIVSMAIAGLM